MTLALTFEVGQTTTVVPGNQVDALLEQLERPRGGQAGAEATSLATLIRRALDGTPSNVLIEKRFALVLLAAIGDVGRVSALGPETRALRAPLAELVGIEGF